MSGEVEVRTMSPGDHLAVKDLVLAGMAERWGVVNPDANPDLDDLAAAHRGSRTVVAERDGRIVATGTLVPRGDGTGEILRTSVAKQHRRAGLGRLVVDELLATGHRWALRRVYLETNSDWHGSIEFWRACGFQVTHRASGPYGEETWFELAL